MLRDTVKDTLRSVRAHALRFGLTTLGIVWGIAMLTFLSASMDGYESHFAAVVEKIGQKIVFLFPGSVTKPGVGQRASRAVELKLKDVRRLGALDGVESAGANLFLAALMVRADLRTKLVWSYGVSEDTLTIRSFQLGAGRFITAHDVADRARVVFLGARVARRLFGGRDAVGRTLTIESIPFRVIGVSAAKGEQLIFSGAADDELAFVPVTTAQYWFTRSEGIGDIVFAPRTRESSWSALAAVRGLLALHHDFRVEDDGALGSFNIQEPMRLVELLLLALRLFLTWAIVITLLVGSAGVMNVMFVVVTERVSEVGLRKAIGASNGAIFVQFLAETVTVTVLAGSVGALFGWLAVRGSAALIGQGSFLIATPSLTLGALVVIACTMVGVGIASGVLPALRATRIDPAVSLRA